jgi:hypothetical protein
VYKCEGEKGGKLTEDSVSERKRSGRGGRKRERETVCMM